MFIKIASQKVLVNISRLKLVKKLEYKSIPPLFLLLLFFFFFGCTKYGMSSIQSETQNIQRICTHPDKYDLDSKKIR